MLDFEVALGQAELLDVRDEGFLLEQPRRRAAQDFQRLAQARAAFSSLRLAQAAGQNHQGRFEQYLETEKNCTVNIFVVV